MHDSHQRRIESREGLSWRNLRPVRPELDRVKRNSYNGRSSDQTRKGRIRIY